MAASWGFVGREAPLAELRAALASARAGRGRVVLVAGEAGIGKTRLAAELVAEAAAGGVPAHWGRCWEHGGAPALWPWTQVLRDCARGAGVAADLGDGADEREVPEQRRFALWDRVGRYLEQVTRREPRLVVLDDLHAADISSLLLLEFLARSLATMPLMILGTMRPVEAARRQPADSVLAAVAREGSRIELAGFTPSDISRFLSEVGASADASTVGELHRRTDGNPLFLSELVRLRGNDSSAAAPTQLRALLRRRLEPLTPGDREVLEALAVLASGSAAQTVAGVLAAARGGACDAIDAERVLEEARSWGLARRSAEDRRLWCFVHELLRETVYEDISPARRRALHEAAAGILAKGRGQASQDEVAGVLAHHYLSAGRAREGAEYALDAARACCRRAAFEEAERLCQAAMAELADGSDDTVRRAEVLLVLGEARWGMGDAVAMREAFARAAALADELAAPVGPNLLALAALGLGGRQQRAHLVYDPQVVGLLERALAGLGKGESALRARLLARLAYALYLRPDSAALRRSLCEEAVALARDSGDNACLRWVLTDVRWALWASDTLDLRRAWTAELSDLAERSGDLEARQAERAWRIVNGIETGDLVGADAELATYAAAADQARRPWFDWYLARLRALRAMIDGRWEDAEAAADAGLAAASRFGHPDAAFIHGASLMALRIAQGRGREVEAALLSLVGRYPDVGVWRATLASVYATDGREDLAREQFERMAADNFAAVPEGYLRLPALADLAEVAAMLGDGERAARLYALLAPAAGRFVVLGFGVAARGLVDRLLAMLALAMGQRQRAAAHLEAALRDARRIGAKVELESLAGLAERIEALADGRAGADTAALAADPAPTPSLPIAGPQASRTRTDVATEAFLLRDGELWRVGLGERSFHLPALRGLDYLHALLSRPDREVAALDLVRLVGGQGGAVAAGDAGDAGELLDDSARRAYRQRLRELAEELADAEAANDLGRAALLRAQSDALASELSRAFGLGGRARRAGSGTERARVSVTKCIAAARRRIERHDRRLARYLAATVQTGTFCCYRPDTDRPLLWRLSN